MSKRRQLPRESGVVYRGLFLGGLSKIGELLINIRFSVEKAYISLACAQARPNHGESLLAG